MSSSVFAKSLSDAASEALLETCNRILLPNYMQSPSKFSLRPRAVEIVVCTHHLAGIYGFVMKQAMIGYTVGMWPERIARLESLALK